MPKPLVSICCVAYNHGAYIRECLEGFLMQKTDFPFEVLIHDDASTDGTADIIREYEAKYPEIIKPVYQTENQYSKGVRINDTFNYPRAQGNYLALCEGDDFWCDSDKLQKQVDFLESHPDYSCCSCGTFYLDEIHRYILKGAIYDFSTYSTTKSLQELLLTIPHLPSTASLLFRMSAWHKMQDSYQRDCKGAPMGDYQMFFHLAGVGKLHFLPEHMMVYRMHLNSASAYNSEKERHLLEVFRQAKIRVMKNNGYEYLIPQLPVFTADCDQKKTLKSVMKSWARKILRLMRGNYYAYQKYISLKGTERIQFIYEWGRRHHKTLRAVYQ